MFVEPPLLDAALRGAVLSSIGLAWMVLIIRSVGLRSLSKMTNFDFVTTVAAGSLLAGTAQATDLTGTVQPLVAMAALFGTQFAVSFTRKRSDTVEDFVDNCPRLLMRDGVIDQQALTDTRVTEADLIAKLREANVLRFEDVRAVVLEATGDVSVLHGDHLDDALIEGIHPS